MIQLLAAATLSFSFVLDGGDIEQQAPSVELTVTRLAERARELERRLYIAELENEATRVLADAMALDIGTGAGDLASTGWAIANGAVEKNVLLGGSRTNALIIVGTKAAALAVNYWQRRRQLSAWKRCMLARYDMVSSETCSQRDNARRTAKIGALIRTGLTMYNTAITLRQGSR